MKLQLCSTQFTPPVASLNTQPKQTVSPQGLNQDTFSRRFQAQRVGSDFSQELRLLESLRNDFKRQVGKNKSILDKPQFNFAKQLKMRMNLFLVASRNTRYIKPIPPEFLDMTLLHKTEALQTIENYQKGLEYLTLLNNDLENKATPVRGSDPFRCYQRLAEEKSNALIELAKTHQKVLINNPTDTETLNKINALKSELETFLFPHTNEDDMNLTKILTEINTIKFDPRFQ